MTKISIKQCLFLILISSLCSCTAYKKGLYFQDVQETETIKINENLQVVHIQTGDILGINVSSRNPESSAIFNYNLNRVNGPNSFTDNPVIGYLVDEGGFIHLPLLGTLKVDGLTISELRATIEAAVAKLYNDPVVNIRIINFKVSILGDVLRPNVYTLQSDQTNILDALTLAGDLNTTAERKNILLIRVENGERKLVHLDITSKKFMSSPYFYLKNNDKIYVSPGRSKFSSMNEGGYRTASLILSGLSIIAILLSRY